MGSGADREVAVGIDGASVGVLLMPSDAGKFNTLWICEKWSEDAVEYARRKIKGLGVSYVQDARQIYQTVGKFPVPSFWLRKLLGGAEIVEEVPGNLLLNEGIQELWDLAIAAGGTTAYNNANAEIGVGDSSTAAAATQTDLQAASNKLFKAMVASYPQRTNQTVDFRSDFTSGEANFAWAEWSVRNGNTRNKNLNRKVESLGTKSTGTWTLTASITIS